MQLISAIIFIILDQDEVIYIKMTTNIALIGFMGVGKSAVGRTLAERLGKRFVETDALIERKAGKPIFRIFQDDGEIAFRELEIAVIKEVSGQKDQVIACGGGVVLNWINIDRLKQDAVMVWLITSPGVILKRIAADMNPRPLLKRQSKISDIRTLLNFRKPFYERAADIEVDTSKLDISSVVDHIMVKIQESGLMKIQTKF
jgi:shikimate kinase